MAGKNASQSGRHRDGLDEKASSWQPTLDRLVAAGSLVLASYAFFMLERLDINFVVVGASVALALLGIASLSYFFGQVLDAKRTSGKPGLAIRAAATALAAFILLTAGFALALSGSAVQCPNADNLGEIVYCKFRS